MQKLVEVTENVKHAELPEQQQCQSDNQSVHSSYESTYESLEHLLGTSNLSNDQKYVAHSLLLTMVKQKHKLVCDQFLGLLTGKPGTGKTFTIQSIINMNNDYLKTGSITTSAYNGINATHVGGQTLVSLLKIRLGGCPTPYHMYQN